MFVIECDLWAHNCGLDDEYANADDDDDFLAGLMLELKS